MIHESTKQYEWDAIEHEHSKKSVDWFWALGIIILTGIILSIISKNYLLAILLALGGALIGWRANDDEELVHVEISERGIKLNRDLYTYDTIKSFWMYVDHRDRNRLIRLPEAPLASSRILQRHRRAGWTAALGAGLALLTAAIVLVGMYERTAVR